jgi:hypothetical protein
MSYRVVGAKRHDLCNPRDKFNKYSHELIYFAIPYCIGKVFQKELDNSLPKMPYLHGKEKIQYILLFYQLYNLVGHRFSLLYILDELVKVTF